MKPTPFFIFSLFLYGYSFAQLHPDAKRDNFWVLGYDSNPIDIRFGGTDLNFSNCKPDTAYNNRVMSLWNTSASICDKDGELLFYTNGIFVADETHEQMENGHGLNPGIYTDVYLETGLPVPQGAIALPFPNTPAKYILIHGLLNSIDDIGIHYEKIFYSIIDMSLNSGSGMLIHKNIPIINDTLDYGKITATRHANGRDWWILVPEHNTNRYLTILLNDKGINNLGFQSVGDTVTQGLGQAVFSPDGTIYVRNDLFGGVGVADALNVYDFDRCTGLLSNQTELIYADSALKGGVVISPNSRFLYVPHTKFVFQFDLEAPDLDASRDTVGVIDNFVTWTGSGVAFAYGGLASDNKIYLSAPGSVNYLHIIHNPNEKGKACNMENHGLNLPTLNAQTIPNFPNFRLGPLDGSPCDTLGIDNLPLAGFRFEQDSLDSLHFQFTSLSFFEPETWHWDFGDGDTSNEIHPIHIFEEKENYEVCLSVSNEYGEDTFCKVLELNPTSVKDTEDNFFNIQIYPNPANDFILVKPEPEPFIKINFELFNTLGQRVLSERPEGSKEHEISLSGVESGVYFYQITEDGIFRKSGKVIIQK